MQTHFYKHFRASTHVRIPAKKKAKLAAARRAEISKHFLHFVISANAPPGLVVVVSFSGHVRIRFLARVSARLRLLPQRRYRLVR